MFFTASWRKRIIHHPTGALLWRLVSDLVGANFRWRGFDAFCASTEALVSVQVFISLLTRGRRGTGPVALDKSKFSNPSSFGVLLMELDKRRSQHSWHQSGSGLLMLLWASAYLHLFIDAHLLLSHGTSSTA